MKALRWIIAILLILSIVSISSATIKESRLSEELISVFSPDSIESPIIEATHEMRILSGEPKLILTHTAHLGVYDEYGDIRWYDFEPTQAKIYLIEINDSSPGVNTILYLYEFSEGDYVFLNSHGSIASPYNNNSRILWNATSNNTLVFGVINDGTQNGTYTVRVREFDEFPELNLSENIEHTFEEGEVLNHAFFINELEGDACNEYLLTAEIEGEGNTFMRLFDSEFNLLKYNDKLYYEKYYNDSGLSNDSSIVFCADKEGMYYVEVVDVHSSGLNYTLNITKDIPTSEDFPKDEFEHNNCFDDATNINFDEHSNITENSFWYPGESDFFKVYLPEGLSRFDVSTHNLTNYVDTELIVYDSSKNVVAWNNAIDFTACIEAYSQDIGDADFTPCLSEVTFFTDGTEEFYFIEVFDSTALGGNYSLNITYYEPSDEINVTMEFIEPSAAKDVVQDGLFEVTINFTCESEFCGDVTAVLDPIIKEKRMEPPLLEVPSAEIPENIPDEEKLEIETLDEKIIPLAEDGVYIIVFKDDSSKFSTMSIKEMPRQKVLDIQRAETKELTEKFKNANPEIEITREFSVLNMAVAELTPEQVYEVTNSPLVSSIIPNVQLSIMLNESIGIIHADDVWNFQYKNFLNLTGEGQAVCVIDTGVNCSHPNLAHACVEGYNTLDNSTNTTDNNGHGTHVAGIIASNHETNKGVAPDAKIVPVKVLNETTGGISNVFLGIDWCVNNSQQKNISVISMSLGINTSNDAYSQFCITEKESQNTYFQKVLDVGIVPVAASGNDENTTHLAFPACLPNVVSVGSVNKSKNIAGTSNRGELLDLMAPGVIINSTLNTGGFGTNSGTSMAAPHVSGAILLLNQYYRLFNGNNVPKNEVLDLFKSTGFIIEENEINYSLINVSAALEEGIPVYPHAIPMDYGIPFHTTTHPVYTNSSLNPIPPSNLSCLTNMEEGDSCVITWVVNATGETDSTWDFFAIATSQFGEYKLEDFESETIEITIVEESTLPQIEIISPEDKSALGIMDVVINTTVTCDASLVSSVKFELINETEAVVKEGYLSKEIYKNYWTGNFSPLEVEQGNYNFTITAENSLGGSNSTSIELLLDTECPKIEIHTEYPQDKKEPELNFTVTDNIELSHVWFSWECEEVIVEATGEEHANNTSIALTYPGGNFFVIGANDTSNNTFEFIHQFYEIFDFNVTEWTETQESRLNNVTDLAMEPLGESVSNNQTFNMTLNTTNFNVTLSDINGTVFKWGYNFTIEEDNEILENLTTEYGSDVVTSLYIDEKMLPYEICNITRQKEENETSTCESLNVSDFNVEVRFSNETAFTEIFAFGQGTPTSLIEFYELEICNEETENCYKEESDEIIVYYTGLSRLVVANDATPPEIKIFSPPEFLTQGYEIYYFTVEVETSPDTEKCNYSFEGEDNITMNKVKTGVFTSSEIGPLENGDYEIEIYCWDGNENEGNESLNFTVIDTTAPEISNIRITPDERTATIRWDTDEPATSKIRYSRSCSGGTLGSIEGTEEEEDYVMNHIIDLTGLRPDTTYYYEITSEDFQGNSKILSCNSSLSFDTQEAEVEDIIAASEGTAAGVPGVTKITMLWQALLSNTPISFEINSENIAISNVTFVISTSHSSAQMSVESLMNNKPIGLPNHPGNAYQYFRVLANFMDKIESIEFYFTIPKIWFTSNNTDYETVQLWHYTNNEWVKEQTTFVRESGNNYVFRSSMSSLSYFAITADEKIYVPTCGDGICDAVAGQTCETCPEDCGPCPPEESETINDEERMLLELMELLEKEGETKEIDYVLIGAITIIAGCSAFAIWWTRFRKIETKPEKENNVSKPKIKKKKTKKGKR